jgi:dTDP-4-dehydrorhamnose reductase
VRTYGAQLVFFSTDYVFDGTAGPYAENDPPNPINAYGKAKLEAERIIQGELDNYLIIRLSGVYGWEPRRKNFVTATIDKLRRGESMAVPSDQTGTPTYAANMTDVVLSLVERRQRGIVHVAGGETMNRYTFGCLVADAFGLDKSLLEAIPSLRLDQKAQRPLSCGLSIDKVQAIIGGRLIGPQDGLQLMREAGDAHNEVTVIREGE